MPTDYDIVSDFTQDYNRAYMLLNTYYAQAYQDVGMYLSNQWTLEQLRYLNSERRNSFTYNKVRKTIDMVSGYLSANQQASIVVPYENSSEQTAEQLTELMRHVMQPAGYDVIRKARHNSLVSGIAWVSPWIDYRQDYVNGRISFHLDNWNDVIWDPFSTRLDLEDATFVARRKYLSKDVIKSLVPGCEREIDAMGYGNRDEKFTYEPYARQWGLQELLAYNEYWKQRYKKGWILVDKVTGEQKPWKGNKKRLDMLQQFFPNLAVIEGYYKTVEYNIIVENRLLYSGEDPWGIGEYPFVPFYSIFDPSYDLFQWRIQGLVRLLSDPQQEHNMFKSKLIDLVDSQIGSGWKAKSGAVSNPKALFQSGQGKVVFFNPGFELSDAERIDPPTLPESLFQLQDSFDSDMKEMVDLGALGNDQTDRMSSVLYKMKQSMAIMQLGPIIDNFKESQRLLSKKVLKMIQKYTPEKVERIIKTTPTPEFYNGTFLEYDVDISETIMTDTQKQWAFMQAWTMKMGGVNVPDEMLWELSPFPIDKKFKQQMEEQRKAAEAAQQQEIEDKKQVNELLKAKAFTDVALGEERLSRIKYDAALSEERLAAAQEERSRSVLNDIKAAHEIQELELGNAEKLLNMVRGVEEEHRLAAADTVVPQPAVEPVTKVKAKRSKVSV
jgi:hypothetical protein